MTNSPLPWKVVDRGIQDTDGHTFLSYWNAFGDDDFADFKEDDPEYIVQACNNFDIMRAALRDLVVCPDYRSISTHEMRRAKKILEDIDEGSPTNSGTILGESVH